MNPTHITCKTAKALREFLGDSFPSPLAEETPYAYNWYRDGSPIPYRKRVDSRRFDYPRYALHDLLSRPFCEAFFKVYGPHEFENGWAYEDDYDVAVVLMERYYRGGLPAVEAELMKMMEAK